MLGAFQENHIAIGESANDLDAEGRLAERCEFGVGICAPQQDASGAGLKVLGRIGLGCINCFQTRRMFDGSNPEPSRCELRNQTSNQPGLSAVMMANK